MKIMDYFDRCNIINLPYRTDRRRDMELELANAGLPLQKGKVEFYAATRPDDAGVFPSLGSRGCFESHYAILKKAQADGLRNVLIMEDDLTIGSKFLEHTESLLDQLESTHWDFVFFGHVLDNGGAGERHSVFLESYPGPIMTAHFYAVNRTVLDRLIAFLDEMLLRPPGHPDGGPMHVDGAYSTFRKQNPGVVTLVAKPSLGWQRSSRSDIYQNQWFDKLPIIRDVVAMIRDIKVKLRGR